MDLTLLPAYAASFSYGAIVITSYAWEGRHSGTLQVGEENSEPRGLEEMDEVHTNYPYVGFLDWGKQVFTPNTRL